MTKPASRLIAEAAELAARWLARPGSVSDAEIGAMIVVIRTQHERLCEGRRRTYFALAMVEAMDHAQQAARDDEREHATWAGAVGLFLPAVRADVLAAIRDETQIRSTTQERRA